MEKLKENAKRRIEQMAESAFKAKAYSGVIGNELITELSHYIQAYDEVGLLPLDEAMKIVTPIREKYSV